MATIGDVVNIYYKEKPAFFARIESITPDIKKDWFMVELLILAIPLRKVTWILREEYINGVPFTMEGNEVRIETVNSLPFETDPKESANSAIKKGSSKDGRKILPFKKPEKNVKKGA